MTVRVQAYGDTGLLVEATDRDVLLGLRAAAVDHPGVLDAVPAEATLLVEFDPARVDADELIRMLQAPPPVAAQAVRAGTIQIPVTYDGMDLTAVAHETGLSVDEVVDRHAAATYTVAFCGFSPGFAYLVGLDERLQVGRLERPRTAVPAGAVAIAGRYAGVYPRSSPGGWRLLGRTDAALWDAARTPPALLQPGARVRFVPS